MEFDKSKILTVVTADNLKCKQKGWVHNSICLLRIEMNTSEPYPVFLNNDLERPFVSEGKSGMFFYPAPEPTYTERQAEWIKANDVKEGTKVRIMRGFSATEDGSNCLYGTSERDFKCKSKIVGKNATVVKVTSENVVVGVESVNDRYLVPFTVLEVIKEPTYRPFKIGDKVIVDTYDFRIATVIDPCDKEDFMYVDMEHIRTGVKKHSCKLITYRPFKNAEEFKPYRDEWFVSKCDNSKSSLVKVQSYCYLGVILLREVTKNDDVVFDLCRWDEFFQWFTRENGEPCGVREEALDE